MRALTPRSRLHGESGASLAVILALIIILGLCVGAIATQGTAGMLAVQGVKNQRGDIYGAESAIDGAINYIRNDLTRARWDTADCPDEPHDLSKYIFKSPSDVGEFTVTCRSMTGSGIETGGANYPENAILTTRGLANYPPEDESDPPTSCSPSNIGLCMSGSSAGEMKVQGTVKVNATNSSTTSIKLNNGTKLNVGQDSVRATGACDPNPPNAQFTGSPVACGSGVTRPDPGGAYNSDPTTGGWAAEMLTMPAPAPLPVCNPTTKIATMSPGSYFDRNAMLRAFTKVVSGVRRSCPVVWMQPGNYYFDLNYRDEEWDDSNDDDGPTILDPVRTLDPWRIGYNDAQQDHIYDETFPETDIPGSIVIGGTLNGVNPSAGSSQVNAAKAAMPGACNKAAAGVQIMMANNMAFDVKDQGLLELCPSPESSRQRIVLYGRKTDQTATTGGTASFRPNQGSSSPGVWDDTFDPNLLAIDTATASTGLQTGSNRTATMSFQRFGPTTVGLMPQQALSNVTLRVAHQETTTNPTTSGVTITAKVIRADNSSPSACTTTTAFTKQTSLTTQQWTVPPGCIGNVNQLAGAKLEWTARSSSSSSSSGLTAVLDGADFNVTYTGQSGLQKKTEGTRIIWMYGDWDDQEPEIYLWGTVYAPTSTIELGLAGVSSTIARFGRGVVVNALKVQNLNVNQPYFAFGNETGVPYYTNRKLELIAWLGTTRMLRVVVELVDTDPTKPGMQVRILSWNAVN